MQTWTEFRYKINARPHLNHFRLAGCSISLYNSYCEKALKGNFPTSKTPTVESFYKHVHSTTRLIEAFKSLPKATLQLKIQLSNTEQRSTCTYVTMGRKPTKLKHCMQRQQPAFKNTSTQHTYKAMVLCFHRFDALVLSLNHPASSN